MGVFGGVLGNYSTRGLDCLGRAFPTAFNAWGKRHFDSFQAVAPHVRIEVASIETQWEAQMKDYSGTIRTNI